MATRDCDNGTIVDLENNGGGCGGNDDDPVPGVQNTGSPTSSPGTPTIISLFLLYYLFFNFYLIDFSKSWRHAALGIAVPLGFLVLNLFLDFAPQEIRQLKLRENDKNGFQLIILVLYYLFFMFYLVGSSGHWWHAVLAIVLVTFFVLLSIVLPGHGNYKDYITPGTDYNDVKPPKGDSNDLSTTLLGARN